MWLNVADDGLAVWRTRRVPMPAPRSYWVFEGWAAETALEDDFSRPLDQLEQDFIECVIGQHAVFVQPLEEQ
jgi:hypothetical protein